MSPPFVASGSLTTDKKQIDDADGWDTQAEWEAYQSASNVEIINGEVRLEEIDVVIDNYEAEFYEDLSRSLSFYYQGDLAQITRQQTTVLSGSWTLELTTGGSPYSVYDTGNLNGYPTQGRRFRAQFQLDSGSPSGWNGRFLFGGPGVNNCYTVDISDAGSNFGVGKYSGGSYNNFASNTFNYSRGTLYEVEVGWSTANELDVTLYEGQTVVSDLPVQTDSEHNADGFGYELNSPGSSTIFADNIRDVGTY